MGSIFIIGNIVKDVYLQLDERRNKFEMDEENVPWLNVDFSGNSYDFFKRTSVFGGATVTKEVFEKFGFSTEIMGAPIDLDCEKVDTGDCPVEYRYILSYDDHVAYLTSEERNHIQWQEPIDEPAWILVDRSATVDTDLGQNLKNYLSEHPKVKLAVTLPKKFTSKTSQELAEIANLVFSEAPVDYVAKNKLVIFLENRIITPNSSMEWETKRTELMTHLTVYSIATATLMGALMRRKTTKEALKLVKINIENCSLNDTLTFERLEELARDVDVDDTDISLTAASLVASGKGILAADESGGSIAKKFASMNITDDEQHRRDYRNIFFTTHDLEKFVNGVILFDETARQRADDGTTFVEYLTAKGIIPGIKVDQGLVRFDDSEEKYTKGLVDLPARLADYYSMGLRFAKWRAAFEITDTTPSDRAIEENCNILAEYALECQHAKIVPIVEPEVVYDGDYDLQRSIDVTSKVLDLLFRKLNDYHVDLKACILKCNMVLAGKKFSTQSTPEEVGKATADVLREHVPKELAGVVFLSGGQSVEQATANLQAVTNNGPFPWPVTFSFARALQDPALNAWKGDNSNVETAREAFYERLVANCAALNKK